MNYEPRSRIPSCYWRVDDEEGEGEFDGRTKMVG